MKNGHKMGKNDLIRKNLHGITETTFMNVVLNFYVIWSWFDVQKFRRRMRAKKVQMYK